MPKPDHDTMMRLIREHFNEDCQRLLTFTRWKDGIDVQYPVYAIEAFYDAARAEFQEAGRLHVTPTDTYPDIRAEVTDGENLQPAMSPVTFYVRKSR